MMNRTSIFTLCCGLLISAVLFMLTKAWEDGNRSNEFNYRAQGHASAIQTEFKHIIEDVGHAQTFIAQTIKTNRRDSNNPAYFMDAVHNTVDEPYLLRVAWAIEQGDSAQHLHIVFSKNSDQSHASSAVGDDAYDQDIHAPFALHTGTLGATVVYQDSVQPINILRLIVPVAAHQKSSVVAADNRTRGDDKAGRDKLAGALVIEISIQGLIEHALKSVPVSAQDIVLNELHSDGSTQSLYRHSSRSRTASDKHVHTGYKLIFPFTFEGMQWQLSFEAAPQFIRTHPVMLAWAILFIGGLLSLGFASYRWITARHTRFTEQQVLARTSELSASKKKLKRVMDNLQDVFFQVDVNSKVIACSPSVFDLIGHRQADVAGTHIAKYYTAYEHRNRLLTALRRSADGKLFNYEVQALHKDGSAIWTSCNIQYTYDEHGEINGIEGFIRNISAKKQTEQEKETLQHQMEHAQRLESLGVLAGGIAHDFNNILMAIMGNASLADKKVSHQPDASKEHIAKIISASKSAADLCQQMLAYAGKGRYIIEPIHLSALLRDTTNLFTMSIAPNVRVQYQLQDRMPYIEGDQAQLQQLMMNFTINASEAIDDDGGDVVISTGVRHLEQHDLKHFHLGTKSPQPGDYAYISVADTGCGMDNNTISKIFNPFFSTKFTGRGLGMSAVLGIITGHQGLLQCDSTPGQGTTFTALLPVSNAQLMPLPADVTHPSNQPVNSNDAQHVHQSGTILVIDDELYILEIARIMFADTGWDFLSASDGASGVELFKQHQDSIVVIVLDMTMPGMDGLATFDAIMAINPRAQVLLSTGYSEQEATQRFSGKSLAGFLQKPYTLEQLQHKINHLPYTT